MTYDVVGLGNALMDALVIIDDEAILDQLHLNRGTMHPVSHDAWQAAYAQLEHLGVQFASGGSCANTIATIGRLGGESIYCGQVGQDPMGSLYAEKMVEACKAHRLVFSEDVPTGKCLSIVSRKDAERTMLTDLGAAVRLDHLGDFQSCLEQTRYAHFTGYTLLDGPMGKVVDQAMTISKTAGAFISLDVADPFVVHNIRDEVWRRLESHVDIVFLNKEEAKALTGQDPQKAIESIIDGANVSVIVVKLGAKGSLIWANGQYSEVQAPVISAVDTTGAGDAYAGGFLWGLSRGWSGSKAGILASEVAALTVSQLGAVVTNESLLQQAIHTAEQSTL